MPAKRELTMRQLRYMLRLHHDGVSARAIGRTLGVARSTIVWAAIDSARRCCDTAPQRGEKTRGYVVVRQLNCLGLCIVYCRFTEILLDTLPSCFHNDGRN